MKIALVGMSMVGKTTLAQKIAKYYNLLHLDTDAYIEQEYNTAIQNLFVLHGEERFRLIEHQVLKEILQNFENNSFVLSCGGGLPCFHNNTDILKAYTYTIYLDAPISFFEMQLKNNPEWKNRPLLKQSKNSLQTIQNLIEQRKPFYEQARYKQIVYPDIEQTFDELTKHLNKAFF
jgi:shikimate kinase